MGDKQRKLKDKASRAYSEGDLKDALKLYERVVFEDPTELQCQLKIGDIHRKMGNFDAAVTEYEPVARAYAEDGLLLKAIAVCKMILSVDADHTSTQAMLADLYAKRRGTPAPQAAATAGPPVTLAGMGISPPSHGSVPGMDYGMIDLSGGGGLQAPDAPTDAPTAWPQSNAVTDTPAWPSSSSSTPEAASVQQPAWPTSTSSPEAPAPTAPGWPQTNAPPAAAWPASGAPPAAAWPASGATAPPASEDSDLEIVVGEVVEEPKVIVGERLEDSELDITVSPEALETLREGIEVVEDQDDAVEVDADGDTSSEIASLLTQLSEDDSASEGDEPLEIEADDGEGIAIGLEPTQPSLATVPPAAPEGTWDGVIQIEDVDAPPAKAEVVAVDEADVEPDAPVIELTSPIEDSTGDVGRPQIPLFSDLPKNAFIELLVQMDMREMQPGEYVIREGETGDSFFVVASGRVRVTRRGADGNEIDLAILTDGAFFGEMALLQDGARTASVVVDEEAQIFEINKDVLDHVVNTYPSVAAVLRNFYRQRLLSTAMATHPLFAPFSPDERRTLMERFKSKNFVAGDILLEEGKRGTGLFILLYGALEVAKSQPGGDKLVLASLGPGDMFGEMSLLTNQPTVASVKATSDCFVLRLSKKKFDELIMTHPQILELVAMVSDERASLNDALLGEAAAFNAGAVLV